MGPHARILFTCALLAGFVAGSGCLPSYGADDPAETARWERESFVHGYRGPYRGRVIDADTKEPLAGAAVLARWTRLEFALIDTREVFYAAREVVTDATGSFVLHAEDIERNPPWRTYRPEFVIYFSGYGVFPWYPPTDLPEKLFEGPGTTVELRRFTDRRERLKVIRELPPRAPDELMPNLIRLMNIEERSLGLEPTHTKGK